MLPQSIKGRREIKPRDIEPGDRVLVEFEGEREWETVRDVSDVYVSTEEFPTGYRIDAVVAHEPREDASL